MDGDVIKSTLKGFPQRFIYINYVHRSHIFVPRARQLTNKLAARLSKVVTVMATK